MSIGTVPAKTVLTERIASNALPVVMLPIIVAVAVAEPAFLTPDNLIGIVETFGPTL